MLNRFANVLMDDRTRVRHNGGNQFVIYGNDKILGTNAAVAVTVNRRGNITELASLSLGRTNSANDDLFMWLDVDKPRSTVKWFSKYGPDLIESAGPSYIHPSRIQSTIQSIANAYSEALPGLEGGPFDVYLSFGNYEAWA